jgi:prepilin-type N-terminal cleavage/methylation domain-containing protein
MSKDQRGDTIIEVMLALAVIGMILAAAFGIANRSILIGQDAQERSEALKLAESQVEVLKVRMKEATFSDVPSIFCYLPDGSMAEAVENACSGFDGNGGRSGGFYSVNITKPETATGTYEVTVSWSPYGDDSKLNNASLYYRIGVL